MLKTENEGFIKKIIFKLIKKHIAGSTTDSVIRTALKLNEKNIKCAITFLNENPKDGIKARYNANSYIHLMKQLSRLHVNSDISLRLSQIGYNLKNGFMKEALEDISKISNSTGINVWIEREDFIKEKEVIKIISAIKNKNIGIELPGDYLINDSELIKNINIPIKFNISIIQGHGVSKMSVKEINKVSDILKKNNVNMQSNDEVIIYNILKKNKSIKKRIYFETFYGMSNSRINRLMKENINLCIYIPYGKDWVPYATSRLYDGKMKRIAFNMIKKKGNANA